MVMKKSKTQALVVINGGEGKPLKGEALIRAMAAVAVKDYSEKKERVKARMDEIVRLWRGMIRERFAKWASVGSVNANGQNDLPEYGRGNSLELWLSIDTTKLEPDAIALCKEYHELAASIQKPYGYDGNPMAHEIARIKQQIASAELEAVVGNDELSNNLRSLLKQLDSKPKAAARIEW